ncbi:MAG: GNAT family N-acetyltransferase [Bryobacteraceae bacterium]
MLLSERQETEVSSAAAPELLIRPFHPGDEHAFKSLNEEWITQYFRLEPKDQESLSHPQRTILDRGGRILFAVIDGACVGCCALVRINDSQAAVPEFEVAKMAVSPAHRKAGIGRKLLHAAVEEGWRLGAKRLYLETNHVLTPAIHLYESLGFVHLDPERVTPSPYARADVYMELLLSA